ncbi:unnamed protein product [Rodentolepis nana]|uniref:Reverse transcriptase domain-containing protein n=1 Tax=Rodentolepis nana TaxID=102285 RepID=A0A0R3T264_RODNA|nr:unnamed protein product [Rodentolepis nana]
MLTLLNKIWETGLLPTQRKVAIVKQVLKKGKGPSNFDKYRHISLTSVLANHMKTIVNRWLTWFLETNNILRSEQAGFSPQRSTNKQVATFSQHIKDTLDARNIFTPVFVDFKAAYDLVWKEKQILKFAKIGIKHNMPNWIKEIIGQRSLNTTYKMFIQPIIFYCCEPLITPTEVTLKPFEKAHNHVKRLITGKIKSTPIDAMLIVTGSTTICSRIKEKALILYEKLRAFPWIRS